MSLYFVEQIMNASYKILSILTILPPRFYLAVGAVFVWFSHKIRIQILLHYTLFYRNYTTTIVWNASRFFWLLKIQGQTHKRQHHSKPFKCSSSLVKGVLRMRTERCIICRYNWIADYSIIMLVHKITWIFKINRGPLANQKADTGYNV